MIMAGISEALMGMIDTQEMHVLLILLSLTNPGILAYNCGAEQAEVAERQTRYVQGVVSVGTCGFKSRLRHHLRECSISMHVRGPHWSSFCCAPSAARVGGCVWTHVVGCYVLKHQAYNIMTLRRRVQRTIFSRSTLAL